MTYNVFSGMLNPIQSNLVVCSSYLVGEPLESCWHLRHHPYVQHAKMWKDAVTGLLL